MVQSLLLKIPQTGRRCLFKHPEIVVGFLKATRFHVSTMCCLPLKTKTLPVEIHTVPSEQSTQPLRHKNLQLGEATSRKHWWQIPNKTRGTLGVLQHWHQTVPAGKHQDNEIWARKDTPPLTGTHQGMGSVQSLLKVVLKESHWFPAGQSKTHLSKVLKLLQA